MMYVIHTGDGRLLLDEQRGKSHTRHEVTAAPLGAIHVYASDKEAMDARRETIWAAMAL